MPRTKGATNKNKVFLLNRLKDQYGDDFEPIMMKAQNAVRMQAIADEIEKKGKEFSTYKDVLDSHLNEFEARAKCVDAWEKIANYTTPKIKAITPEALFEFDVEAKPNEQVNQIIKAVSDGCLPLETAKSMLQAIRLLVDIDSVTDLKDRIEALESTASAV